MLNGYMVKEKLGTPGLAEQNLFIKIRYSNSNFMKIPNFSKLVHKNLRIPICGCVANDFICF